MKICFFGIYDPTYSRNSVLLSGLRQNGVEVVECWADWRDPKRYRKLLQQLRALHGGYDYIYAAYPSSVPVMIAKLLSRKPVVIDAFYSNFDSVVNDRKKYHWFDPRAIKMLVFDWLGVILADLLIADTDAHATYWRNWWGMKRKPAGTVYIGIDDKVFHPMVPTKKDYILVLFHGTFIPLQGVTKIVEAAHICAAHPEIRFRFVGNGRDFGKAKGLADRHQLRNIEFTGMRPLAEMNKHLAEADIIMGIFGDTAKARRVIPNKVYEGLYAKRPVMTMDGPVIREAFTERDLLLVHNDPQAIADGIVTLAKDPALRNGYAERGFVTVAAYLPKPVAASLVAVIEKTFDLPKRP